MKIDGKHILDKIDRCKTSVRKFGSSIKEYAVSKKEAEQIAKHLGDSKIEVEIEQGMFIYNGIRIRLKT